MFLIPIRTECGLGRIDVDVFDTCWNGVLLGKV